MNLHEYQGKDLLNSFGVEIQRGIVVETPAEAVVAAKKLTEDTGTGWHIIKAQMHAGGRGKGGLRLLSIFFCYFFSISRPVSAIFQNTQHAHASPFMS